ncbi:MAG: exodeoxyribonuclease VII large subunit, partial [Bdellovibrionales bacterium]|nr:exodeoxyribonuclease VII large subunit [Bdellovibrionales bacterium]
MANQILEVSVANAYLKQLLESDEILSDCWIQGEVSERFEARSGHIYFTLTDEQSTLKCVIFRGNALRQRAPFR